MVGLDWLNVPGFNFRKLFFALYTFLRLALENKQERDTIRIIFLWHMLQIIHK